MDEQWEEPKDHEDPLYWALIKSLVGFILGGALGGPIVMYVSFSLSDPFDFVVVFIFGLVWFAVFGLAMIALYRARREERHWQELRDIGSQLDRTTE